MKRALLVLTVFSGLLLGCEGMKMISGIVVSESTGKPIVNAEINVLNNIGDSTRTDSSGRFTIKTGFTGMMFGGPKFKFEVRKDGYETQIIKSKSGVDTVKLLAN